MDDDNEDRPLRSRQKISFFRRLILKLRFLNKVQLAILIVVVLFILGVIIFIVHEYTAASQSTNSPTVTPSPSPSEMPSEAPSPSPLDTSTNNDSSPSDNQTASPDVSPTVACVGPDGKTLYVTQQQCDSFNAAWATPTPTAAPVTPTVTPANPTDTPTGTISPTPTPGS